MECQSTLKQTTITELKEKRPPKLPRKISNTLVCALVNKSPINAMRKGSMFSLTLCDEDQLSTIQAVCFTKDIFSKIEPKKTYKLEEFKLKQLYEDKIASKLLLDHETKISLLTTKVAMQVIIPCCHVNPNPNPK